MYDNFFPFSFLLLSFFFSFFFLYFCSEYCPLKVLLSLSLLIFSSLFYSGFSSSFTTKKRQKERPFLYIPCHFRIFKNMSMFGPSQTFLMGFPDSSVGKESTCNVGDLGLIPGLERSPWEGKGYPLQYSGLENSMDCIVHGVTKSWTWLSDFHFTNLPQQQPW